MSFVKREIEVTITKHGGKLGTGNTKDYVLKDYRVECDIQIAGGYTMGICQARIYGLPLSQINEFTSIGATFNTHYAKNAISISAGEEGKTLSLIYQGEITYAFGQFRDAPNVSLNITAIEGSAAMLRPVAPTSYKGSVPASVVMHKLATEAGYGFENDGVTAQLRDPYYTGTVMYQIRSVKKETGINYVLDRNVLHIWPKNGKRSGYIPTVGPGTGLMGYAQYSSKYTQIQTIFMPDVLFGSSLKIEGSEIAGLNGQDWYINRVQHLLAAQVPGGPWFTNMTLQKVKKA